MAFIESSDPVVLNIKLTTKGRELLAGGSLDFKYYVIGDSEIDYDYIRTVNAVDSDYTAFDSTILRPADRNADIISSIPSTLSGDSYNEMTNVPTTAYNVENEIESLGFFTNSNTEYIVDSNHVKQPDMMVYMDNVAGGNSLELLKASSYGTSGEEPAVGDILLVKWSYNSHSTGFTINSSEPKPNLFYKIIEIESGTLASGSVTVKLDRDIPDFGTPTLAYYAGAMLYYNEIAFTGDTISDMSSTDYIDESVLTFLDNSQCPTVVFPFWNMSIIFTEEIAGIQTEDLKYTQFNNKSFGGFVSYIQNQAPTIKKLGVIHYTNSSPANVYGEGFLLKTPSIVIPTIMWHKTSTKTLGTTLAPIGTKQLLSGLNLYYYELADTSGYVVGKMFCDLKIFVIEDQELLFAMSYKSNRSWSLPNYSAGTTTTISGTTTVTGGTNVTWIYPSLICSSYACYPTDGVEYCHSTQDWTSLSASECSVSCSNIFDAGYRVTACICSSVCGGGLYTCAYDFIGSTNICTANDGGAGGTTITTTISDINYCRAFYFDGKAG